MAKQQLPSEFDPAELLEISRKVLLHRSIEKARSGDVWPFVACQWPNLIIAENDPDAKFFPRVKINDGPELWVRLRIDHFQREIIESFYDGVHRECAIKGCTKPGKGFAVALAVCAWFDIFNDAGDPCKILLTGPEATHTRTTLFAEVKTLRSKMKMPGPSRATAKEIKDPNEDKHFILVLNPLQPEGFSGKHSSSTLFVFDEASSVPDEFYIQAKKQSHFIASISNPRVLTGWFHGLFLSQDASNPVNPNETQSIRTSFGMRRLITVDGAEVMNVKHKRLEQRVAPEEMVIDGKAYSQFQPIPMDVWKEFCRPLIPAQMDYERYLSICAEKDPKETRVYGRGWFPKSDTELQVIPTDFIIANIDTVPREDIEVSAFGLDVALSADGDWTVMAVGGLRGVKAIERVQKKTPVEVAMWVIQTALEYGVDTQTGTVPVCIDETGSHGKNVSTVLKPLGVKVIGVWATKTPTRNKHEYGNLRAQLYGELRRRLDPEGKWTNDPWNLPNDTELHEELYTPHKLYGGDGVKYLITPKDWRRSGTKTGMRSVKAEIGRSPDKADAVVHLYHAVAIQESRIDPSNRQLIYNIGEEKPDRRELSQSEQLDRHIAGLAERMDRMYDERYADETWAYGA